MMITYHPFSPDQVRRSADQIVAIYDAAFRPAPYLKSAEEIADFAQMLDSATRRAGFRAVVAQLAQISQPIGFCYGYDCVPSSDFYQTVSGAMSDTLRSEWLDDSFQLAEMATLPLYQGQGVGGRLHDRLMTDLTHKTAVLATMVGDTNAVGLYRSRGWQPLVAQLNVLMIDRSYQIMGVRVDSG